MLIESKIKREGGSKIDLGARVYHFQPLADGAHVAEVLDAADQDCLLAIPHGFGLYRGTLAPTGNSVIGAGKPAAPAPTVADAPIAASLPVTFNIHGVTYTKQEIAARAVEAAKLDMHVWNGMTDDERENLMIEELDKLEMAGPPPAPVNASTQSDAELRAEVVKQYQAMFNGAKPHHKWSIDTIRDKIAAGPQ